MPTLQTASARYRRQRYRFHRAQGAPAWAALLAADRETAYGGTYSLPEGLTWAHVEQRFRADDAQTRRYRAQWTDRQSLAVVATYQPRRHLPIARVGGVAVAWARPLPSDLVGAIDPMRVQEMRRSVNRWDVYAAEHWTQMRRHVRADDPFALYELTQADHCAAMADAEAETLAWTVYAQSAHLSAAA